MNELLVVQRRDSLVNVYLALVANLEVTSYVNRLCGGNRGYGRVSECWRWWTRIHLEVSNDRPGMTTWSHGTASQLTG
jgi:hypothetical protein